MIFETGFSPCGGRVSERGYGIACPDSGSGLVLNGFADRICYLFYSEKYTAFTVSLPETRRKRACPSGYAEHVRKQLAFRLSPMNDQRRLTDAQLLGQSLGTYLAGKVIVSILEGIHNDSLLLLSQAFKRRVEREDRIGQRDNPRVQPYPLKGLEKDPQTSRISQQRDSEPSIPYLVRSGEVSSRNR